jgi:hypothetical protein
MRVVATICAVIVTVAITVGVAAFVVTTRQDSDQRDREHDARVEACVRDAFDDPIPTYSTNGRPIPSAYEPSEADVRTECERRTP